MKPVSYKTAEFLKRFGYDEPCEYAYLVFEDGRYELKAMEKDWEMRRMNNSDLVSYLYDTCEPQGDVTAPYYFDVWNWLFKEKQIYVKPIFHPVNHMYSVEIMVLDNGSWISNDVPSKTDFSTPEDCIVAGIDWLVDNI